MTNSMKVKDKIILLTVINLRNWIYTKRRFMSKTSDLYWTKSASVSMITNILQLKQIIRMNIKSLMVLYKKDKVHLI